MAKPVDQSRSPWDVPEIPDEDEASWKFTSFLLNIIVIPAGCVFILMLLYGVFEGLFSREDRQSNSGNGNNSSSTVVNNRFYVPPNSGVHFHSDVSGRVNSGQLEPQKSTSVNQPEPSSINNNKSDNGNGAFSSDSE